MVILVLYRACLLWERGLDTATDWIGEHVGLPSGAILAAKKAAHWPHRLASVSRSYRYACLVNARDRVVICVCPRPGEAMVRVRLFAFDPEHGHDAVVDAASMPATWWPMQAARVVWRDIERGDIPVRRLSREDERRPGPSTLSSSLRLPPMQAARSRARERRRAVRRWTRRTAPPRFYGRRIACIVRVSRRTRGAKGGSRCLRRTQRAKGRRAGQA